MYIRVHLCSNNVILPYSIQDIVSKQAKKLDNNYDVIQFVYKDGKKFIPVASSQKNKFLIKPVKLKNQTNS
ncbi:hypothetical protein COSHB9_00130 [Companilactobacillus alimentarius]